MVQVLPYVPSFLERLTPAIGNLAAAGGAYYGQRAMKDRIAANEEILKDPNASPLQKVQAYSRMPESYKKSASPVWAAVLGPEAQSMASRKELEKMGFKFNEEGAQTAAPGEQKPEGQSIAKTNQSQLNSLSDEQLVAMSALGGASEKLAAGEIKRREVANKKEEALWNYKPTQDFLKDIEEQARGAQTAITVADDFIKLAQSGEISPGNLRNFAASKFGDQLPFLYSPATAQAKLLEKLEAAGMRDIFPRPTEKEFFFINSAQAQLGKTDAANVAVANLQKKFASIPIKAAEFSQEVIQENGGTPPRDLTAKVRKKMENYRKDLVDDSASVAFEYGDIAERKKAADFLQTKGKNLPLTDDKKKEIFKLAKGDPNKALQLAIELGYAIPEE